MLQNFISTIDSILILWIWIGCSEIVVAEIGTIQLWSVKLDGFTILRPLHGTELNELISFKPFFISIGGSLFCISYFSIIPHCPHNNPPIISTQQSFLHTSWSFSSIAYIIVIPPLLLKWATTSCPIVSFFHFRLYLSYLTAFSIH